MGDVIRRNYQGLHRVLSMLSHAAQKGEIWAKSKQKTSDFQHISVRDARRASRTEFARAFDRETHSKKKFFIKIKINLILLFQNALETLQF